MTADLTFLDKSSLLICTLRRHSSSSSTSSIVDTQSSSQDPISHQCNYFLNVCFRWHFNIILCHVFHSVYGRWFGLWCYCWIYHSPLYIDISHSQIDWLGFLSFILFSPFIFELWVCRSVVLTFEYNFFLLWNVKRLLFQIMDITEKLKKDINKVLNPSSKESDDGFGEEKIQR